MNLAVRTIARRSIAITSGMVDAYASVHVGDSITAEAEVLSVHEQKPVTQLRVRVERHDGQTVLEGEAWCYTMGPGS
ncbi:MAG TPA: hypothetical protein VMM79_00915 [Longimicrobiales bacterium]|nr:hypothetical protein [Longimicrobiales bacterium]